MSSRTPDPAVYGLTAVNLLAALPDVLRQDPSVAALAEAVSGLLAGRPEEIDRLRIYPAIDALDEPLLDILAHDYKVDWWDPNYSLVEKRRTLQSSWKVHKILGTKAAVETALSAVYPGAEVEEWFEYGGEPYRFRVHIKILDVEYVQSKHKRILARIEWYKNLRSHLERIWYEMPPIIFKEHNIALLKNIRFHLRVSQRNRILLDGSHLLDGSWLLNQDAAPFYMVRTNIRTAVRMPHRLRPVAIKTGVTMLNRERVPLNIRMGVYRVDNFGFVRLDGNHLLDGSWTLDQQPRASKLVFGVIAHAVETPGKLWAVATHVRVIQRMEERIPLRLRAGIYRFIERPERVTAKLTIAGIVREREDTHFQRLEFAARWREANRIVTGLPIVRITWRENSGGLRSRKVSIRTGVQAKTSNTARIQIPIAVKNSFGGLTGQLTISRRDRMDGTYRFDGSRTFGGGEREVMQL